MALARHLVAYEAAGGQSLEEHGEAVEQACRRLRQRLVGVIGQSGFDILFAHALAITKAEFSFLAGVEIGQWPTGCLTGWHEPIQGLDADQARAAHVSLLANLIWLLATFLGEDLSLRLVGQAWPELPHSWGEEAGWETTQ